MIITSRCAKAPHPRHSFRRFILRLGSGLSTVGRAVGTVLHLLRVVFEVIMMLRLRIDFTRGCSGVARMDMGLALKLAWLKKSILVDEPPRGRIHGVRMSEGGASSGCPEREGKWPRERGA